MKNKFVAVLADLLTSYFKHFNGDMPNPGSQAFYDMIERHYIPAFGEQAAINLYKSVTYALFHNQDITTDIRHDLLSYKDEFVAPRTDDLGQSLEWFAINLNDVPI